MTTIKMINLLGSLVDLRTSRYFESEEKPQVPVQYSQSWSDSTILPPRPLTRFF